MAYVCTGLAVYFALCRVPGLLAEVQEILRLFVGGETLGLVGAGPLLIAFVVIGIFPRVPPFRAGERAMRRILYEYASIPAQQISERNRLREAGYDVDPATLDAVRSALGAEGFNPADVVYEATPTTRSLWTTP